MNDTIANVRLGTNVLLSNYNLDQLKVHIKTKRINNFFIMFVFARKHIWSAISDKPF